jgi:hypothetical protein
MSVLTERVYVYRTLPPQGEDELEEPFYEHEVYEEYEPRGTYVDLRPQRNRDPYAYSQVPAEEKPEPRREQTTQA